MSRDTRIAPISGVARPSRRMRRIAEALHGPGFVGSIAQGLQDAAGVDHLAAALDRAFSAALSSDGRLDLREAAMHLMKEMKGAQR